MSAGATTKLGKLALETLEPSTNDSTDSNVINRSSIHVPTTNEDFESPSGATEMIATRTFATRISNDPQDSATDTAAASTEPTQPDVDVITSISYGVASSEHYAGTIHRADPSTVQRTSSPEQDAANVLNPTIASSPVGVDAANSIQGNGGVLGQT